jgi:hypothetical protein
LKKKIENPVVFALLQVALNSCCKRPPVDFAVDPYLKECNPRKTKKLTQWANDFVLNKVQNFRNDNSMDISTDKVASEFLLKFLDI